jgi:cytochrome c5
MERTYLPLAILSSVVLAFPLMGLASAQGPRDGTAVLAGSCTSCHDTRRIETTAHDREGWIEVMNRMLDHGADVGLLDQIYLIDFLVANHGPVPDGEGRELLLNRCTVCHDLTRVRTHRGTRALWEDALQAMLNEGATLTGPEYEILVDYLAEHLGPDSVQ